MKWENKITGLLEIKYPILQAPMLVVTSPEMVAATSNSGCFGILPLGYSDRQKAVDRIRTVKQLTHQPFGVNLFAYKDPGPVAAANTDVLKDYYTTHGVTFPDKIPERDPFTNYRELIDTIAEEHIKAVTFHFGVPESGVVRFLHSQGIRVLATATCVEEAKIIEQAGVDIVVAQGVEAGGNRGTFIEGELPQVGLFSLVPQIVDAVSVPVIAAGGIAQGRSLMAAFCLGAEGVMPGSLFLRATESGATVSWKERIATAVDTSTQLTNVWSGRYGRCLVTRFTEDMKDQQILPSPLQHFMTSALREKGRLMNDPDIQSFWAGQSARYAEEKPIAQLLKQLIDQTEALYTDKFQTAWGN